MDIITVVGIDIPDHSLYTRPVLLLLYSSLSLHGNMALLKLFHTNVIPG